MEVDDLNAGGGGTAWGHTRKFSNRMAYDHDYGNGYNWLVREWPYLVAQGPLVPWSSSSSSSAAGPSSSSSSAAIYVPQTIVVVRTSRSPLWFDYNGAQYVGRYGILDTLTYDPAHSQFVLTSQLGNVTDFQDFVQHAAPQGLFKGYTASGGETIMVAQYSGRKIQQVQRTAPSAGVTEQITYSYAPNGGDLETVLLQRAINGVMTNVRQAQYLYYGSGDLNGSPGDLQTATAQTWNGGSWQDQKVYYYRYWRAIGGHRARLLARRSAVRRARTVLPARGPLLPTIC
ncbi:MAG: hypothetical protein B7Z73_05330 [Planctomycetia bacterium 21-64-5]|nr:MAG: hypothetical protein B7Z73_05330 [Planctomycetia bacterium 21-64-5]